MKIIKLEASNIKRLVAVEIEPNGNVVKITGKNANGKTSIMDAIFWAMSGTRNIQEKPIREGATKASIKLELGELTVERKFTSKGTTLRVTKSTGAPMTSPQSVLDELIGNLAFDPLEFSRLPAKQQFELLREIVVIDGDIDALDEERSGVFLQRTDANRELKALTIERDNLHFAEMSKTPKDEVDPADLVAKINLAMEHKRELNKMADDAASFARTSNFLETKIEEIKADLIDHEAQLFSDQENIKRLAALIKEKGEAPDIEAIQKALSEAQNVNILVRKKAAFNDKKTSADMTEKEVERLCERLDAIDEEKASLMKSATFPVDGLSFDDGLVLFNNLPFEQASSAEQLRVSMAMAMAANPDFRVIRITDGSLMDSDSFKIIEEMADKNDFQVWVEVVDESGDVGIVIEDGQVKKVN